MAAEGVQLGDNRTEAELDATVDARPAIKVHSFFKFDPEAEFDKISRTIGTKIVNIDAKIFEGKIHGHLHSSQRKHYRSAEQFFRAPSVKRRIVEAYSVSNLRDIQDRIGDGSFFKETTLDYPDEMTGSQNRAFAMTDGPLPGFVGPASRQMTLYDVLDQYRKSREAAYRNPLGKRIIRLIAAFVLSRGVKGTHTDPDHNKAWKLFWKQNGMRLRIKDILRELLIYGDQFLRYYNTQNGLVIRSLDPETIWEIVTNPEDIEDVFYYYQQFCTPTQLVTAYPAGANIPASTLIIRQIPAQDIDHIKINAGRTEKRGRGELFSILSWLVRFREFANDRVILGKMRSMFALDVSVDGLDTDVAAANAQFATPPGSGSVLVHNKKIEVEFKNANTNANEAKTDADMILKIIAVGSGVSEQFLGVSDGGSRVSALVQTEPDVKNFEEHREVVEDILLKMSYRVFAHAGLKTDEMAEDMEFVFPALATEDRSAKIKDIALSESMDYFSKSRAATMAAREFDITNYSYEREQEAIREERKDSPVIALPNQQVQKIAPDPMKLAAVTAATKLASAPDKAAPAGKPGSGGKPGPVKKTIGGNKSAVVHIGVQSGFAADGGGRGIHNTKATISRGTFTRGGAKAAIKGNKSTDVPKREAMSATDPTLGSRGPEAVLTSRSGWTEQARTKSILTRKRRKINRLLALAKEAEAALPDHGDGE